MLAKWQMYKVSTVDEAETGGITDLFIGEIT